MQTMKTPTLNLAQVPTPNKLVIIAREAHSGHHSEDIKTPSPVTGLFEHILGRFNEEVYTGSIETYAEEISRLVQMLREAGFKPVYVFEHDIYELVLFVKITNSLYAIVAPPPPERDVDKPVLHPVYIYCNDSRIELPWVAKLITSLWLKKIRAKDARIWNGLDEVVIELDFTTRKARCRRIPVYRGNKVV